MDLIALVDRQVWSLAGEFDDGVAFLGAKLASPGTKGLHTRKWVTLPEDVDLNLDEILELFLGGSFRDQRCKVQCK